MHKCIIKQELGILLTIFESWLLKNKLHKIMIDICISHEVASEIAISVLNMSKYKI